MNRVVWTVILASLASWLASVPAWAVTVCQVQDYDAKGFSRLEGQQVVVTGVVTVPPGVFQVSQTSMYIRGIGDDVCGVNVFSFEVVGGLTLGDTVTVTGEVEEYVSSTSGAGAITEVTFASAQDLTVRPGDSVPEPEVMFTGQVGREENEGKLVRVKGNLVSFVSGTRFRVDDGTGDIEVYDFGGNFAGDSTWLNLSFGDEVTVTGVVSQSDRTLPYFSDYRIFPRRPGPPYEDIMPKRCIPGGSPRAFLRVSDPIFCPRMGEKVTITYNGPHVGRLRLRIFDVYGRCVATLDDRTSLCGETEVLWDGRNELMEELPMGLYHITVNATDPETSAETQESVPVVVGRNLR